MLQRELKKALRSPLTWVVAAICAVLTGHGFVLAIDLFSAGARSVGAGTLLAPQFEPLAGIVRPSLGGPYVALSLLGPLVACRAIAVDKERRTWASLILMRGSSLGVVASATAASLAATLLPLLVLPALWVGWLAVGGHLAFAETAVALSGQVLYGGWLCLISIAVSAWSRTWAQAAAVVLVAVMASWALDTSTGFAALAWLGPWEQLSVSAQLVPFERGAASMGPALYFLSSGLGLFGAAWAGAALQLPFARRVALAVVFLAASLGCAAASTSISRSVDLTEGARLSLPPAQAKAVGALPGPVQIEVEMDRDDARRTQLENDFLFKLRLARPDLQVRFPRDGQPDTGSARDSYGQVRIHVGSQTSQTRGTSVEELTALVFEAAGQPLPDPSQAEYPGWPLVVEGPRRTALMAWAYLLIPGALAAVGMFSFRKQRRRT